jgi:tetratricopeptide (TPR) repeat protein
MFLRRSGRKILLLHSYRDGSGRVCQLRLDHLEEGQARGNFPGPPLERRARSPLFQHRNELEPPAHPTEHTPQRCPPPSAPAKHTPGLVEKRLADLLHTLNSESDPRVIQRVADAVQQRLRATRASIEEAEAHTQNGDLAAAETTLKDLIIKTRAALPARRKRFHEKDPQAQPYLQAQERLAELLKQQGRLQECLETQRQRVAACPTREAQLDLGAVLQLQGHTEAARQQYARLPQKSSWRHYNLAAAALQNEHYDEALGHLLQAFARGRDVVIALRHLEAGRQPGWGKDYWERYGHLWSEKARKFFLVTRAQHLVGNRVSNVAERGKIPRQIIQGVVKQRLLGWIMAALPGAETPPPKQSKAPSPPPSRKKPANSKPKKHNPSTAAPTKTRNN